MVYFPSFFLVKSDLFVRKESRSFEKEEEKMADVLFSYHKKTR